MPSVHSPYITCYLLCLTSCLLEGSMYHLSSFSLCVRVCVFNHITNTGFLLGSLPFHFCPADSVLCNYSLIFKSSSIRVNTPTKYDDKPIDTFWAVWWLCWGTSVNVWWRKENTVQPHSFQHRSLLRLSYITRSPSVHHCPRISLVHLSSPCLFFISFSPWDSRQNTVRSHGTTRKTSSRLGRSVSMVPEKFRSGKEVEVGYQSKSSILFSSQCVYTYSIPPGRGTGPHLLAHFDSACERDIVFASL